MLLCRWREEPILVKKTLIAWLGTPGADDGDLENPLEDQYGSFAYGKDRR